MTKPDTLNKWMKLIPELNIDQLIRLKGNAIELSYRSMVQLGRVMESGTLELPDGQRFSFKLRRLKDKKVTKKEANH